MGRVGWMCLIVLLTWSSQARAAKMVAVIELTTDAKKPAVDAATAKLLTDAVRAGVVDALHGTEFALVSRDLVDQVLAEREKRGEKCELGSCDAEIAGNLGASYFVTGEIGKLGKRFVVTVRLSRQTDNVLLDSRLVRGDSEDALLDGLQQAAGAITKKALSLGAAAPAVTPVSVVTPPLREDRPQPGATKVEEKSGLTLVWIPGGSFEQGCVAGDSKCTSDEKPARRVDVEGFWLGRTEVTVEAYAECSAAGGCSKEAQGNDNAKKTCNWKNGRMDHPMNCVTWAEAREFCRWMGGRLPTASEWEFAAKSGQAVIYPWANEAVTGRPHLPARANFCDNNCPRALGDVETWKKRGWITFNEDDGYAGTAPVGSYPRGQTAWGLMDMAGNVVEWTASAYDENNKEIRGGGWHNHPAALRASGRHRLVPTYSHDSIGFRCGQ